MNALFTTTVKYQFVNMNLEDIYGYVLTHNRAAILEALAPIFRDLEEDDCASTIDEWFGSGSIMHYELGLTIRLTFDVEGILFEIF